MNRIAAMSGKGMVLAALALLLVSLSLVAFQPDQDEAAPATPGRNPALYLEVTPFPATVRPAAGGNLQPARSASPTVPAGEPGVPVPTPTVKPPAVAVVPRTMPLLGRGSEYQRPESWFPNPDDVVEGGQAPNLSRPTATAAATLQVPQPPTRIVARAIGLDSPVVPVGWKWVRRGGRRVAEWQVPKNKAGWHSTSALPGEPGNTVLSGHRNIYAEVFRYVPDLEPGDEISLYAGDRAYVYTVAEKHIVQELGVSDSVRLENGAWIAPTDDVRLTLVTCAPYEAPGNTHRVIVVARPAPPDPGG